MNPDCKNEETRDDCKRDNRRDDIDRNRFGETQRDPEEIELNKETQADKSEESNTKFEKVKKIKEEEYKK